jgi:hypothetical protein
VNFESFENCMVFNITTSMVKGFLLATGLHLVTMNETSILHLAGGKVTLQVRRAVNQSKKPANGQRQPRFFFIIFAGWSF